MANRVSKIARIQLLIDTTANWTAANPILLMGEIGLEIKTNGNIGIKVGDSVTSWNLLSYMSLTPAEIMAIQSELQAEIDAIATASTEGDSEVAQARVNASGVTYATLKARLDAMDTLSLKNAELLSGITTTNISLTFTTQGVTSDYYVNANQTYKITNTSDKTVSVFVDGHSDVSVSIKGNETGVINPQYSGYLRFYMSGWTSGITAIFVVDGKIEAVDSKIDHVIDSLSNEFAEINRNIVITFPSSLSGTKYSYLSNIYLEANKKYVIKNNYSARYTAFIDGYTGVSVDIAAGNEAEFTPQNSGYLKLYTSSAVSGGEANIIVYGDIDLLKKEVSESRGSYDSLSNRLSKIDTEILKTITGHPDVFYNESTVTGYTDFNTLPFNKVFVYTSSITGITNAPTSIFNGVVLTLSLTPSKTYGAQIAITQNTGEMYYRYVRTNSGGDWYKVKKDNGDSPAPSGGDSESVYYVGYGTTGESHYSTFTSCIRALKNDNSKKVIYVNGGTYNIYNEMGGSSFISSLTGNENWYDVCDIVPPNTRIVGKGNVVFEMKLPSTTPDAVAKLLSAVNTRGTCEIENVKIVTQNCRYCIHDETSGNSSFTGAVKIYKNVVCEKLSGDGLGYPQAYAAGFDDNMKLEFENCIFKSYGEVFSMHNRSSSINNSSKVTINNSIFESSNSTSRAIRFGSMNKTLEKIDVMISNSYLSSNVLVRNEYTSNELVNGFDVTLIGCGDKTVDVTASNNQYTPKIYAL